MKNNAKFRGLAEAFVPWKKKLRFIEIEVFNFRDVRLFFEHKPRKLILDSIHFHT